MLGCYLAGSDALDEGICIDNFFALKMAALFLCYLVFDVKTCNATKAVLLHSLGNDYRTSVACVHVGDQRWFGRLKVGNHLSIRTHVVQLRNA